MFKNTIILGALLCTTAQATHDIYTSPHQLTASAAEKNNYKAPAPKQFANDDQLAAHALTTLAKVMTECVKAAKDDENPTAVLEAFGTAVAGIFDIVALALRSGRLSGNADEEEIIHYLESLGADFKGRLRSMLIEQGQALRTLLHETA